MHIVNFQAENYKRLKAINITPDGSVVELVGKNAQGKTSVLDAIWAALAGGEISRVTKLPIREGEKQASVRLDLGEYIITRRWNKNDVGTLTVESPRGAKYSSPQGILDKLIGQRAMDPLTFMSQSGREQVATLIELLGDGLGFDPDAIEKERAEAFDARTELKRDAKKLDARLAAMPDVPKDTPTEEVSIADLLEERNAIDKNNAKVDRLRQAASDAEESEEKADLEVTRLREALDAAIAHQDRATATAAEAYKAYKAVEAIDRSAIDEKLRTIDAVNANVRTLIAQETLAAELADAQADIAALDARLDHIAFKKAEALAKAKFPVDGLSFNEDGVTYNGIPLNQASGAEQLRVSVALAMAMNPELRVLRIDKAEALDSDGLKIIADMAKERDYQVWLSRVDESGATGIIIEDGSVKA